MPERILGKFENIYKRFNSNMALRGLSFNLCKGINGLIGPNGAGKTTAIKLSLGLIKSDTGSAELFGYDCWRESLQVRQRIGVLLEKFVCYDYMTGFEHLKLIAKLKRLPDPATESKKVLKLVELDRGAYSRKINGYSAGMRQRIGLAHALLGTPELVILDEPTSNLDPLGRTRVLEIVNALRKDEGFSFLISSHILPELERVCENVILMNMGKAIREGSLEQLLNDVEPREFMIKTNPIEPLVKLLKVEEGIEEIRLDGDTAFVVVTDSKAFKKRLPLLVSMAKVSLEEVKVSGRDLASLFRVAVSGG